MIFVEGWIKLKSADLEKIEPLAKMMMAESAKEDGCLHYSFAKDLADDSIIRVSERWESERHLTDHFATEHMAEFNTVFSDLSAEAMDIRMYAGEQVRIMMQSG